jgi:hypothetical protein
MYLKPEEGWIISVRQAGPLWVRDRENPGRLLLGGRQTAVPVTHPAFHTVARAVMTVIRETTRQ